MPPLVRTNFLWKTEISGSTKTKNMVIFSIYLIILFQYTIFCIHLLVVLGMLSATASLGLLLLWDVDGGLTQIDKYLYSSEEYIKAGALLACGIVNTGVRNECDPALALLSDYVLHSSNVMRIGAILGKFLSLS